MRNTYQVTGTNKQGEDRTIIVKARNENEALGNAKHLWFMGSNFRNPVLVQNKQYSKPRKQGFYGRN